jgi:hypothetical protein
MRLPVAVFGTWLALPASAGGREHSRSRPQERGPHPIRFWSRLDTLIFAGRVPRITLIGGLELAVIARRDFNAPAGPLRVRLRTTPDGRRWLSRNPKLPVWVFIRTRTGSDRAEVIFESRLG